MNKFRAPNAERLIFMDVKEWYHDYLPKAFTAKRSNLFINVEVTVFDRDQKNIAKSTIKEDRTLPSGWPMHTVPDVYQRKVRQLFAQHLSSPAIDRNDPSALHAQGIGISVRIK